VQSLINNDYLLILINYRFNSKLIDTKAFFFFF